jgi:hypothetical protein
MINEFETSLMIRLLLNLLCACRFSSLTEARDLALEHFASL